MLLFDCFKMAFATAFTSDAVTARMPSTCSCGVTKRPNDSMVCP